METCPACKMPVLEGQPAYQKKDVGTFHSTCGDPLGIKAAVAAERERIASRLMDEAENSPCSEDASVYRSAAWLVRADFSYDEAERLQIADENAVVTATQST